MHKRERWLYAAVIIAVLVPLAAVQADNGPRAPQIGEVLINEFVANPSSGNEWVELYNPTEDTLTIAGLYLDDVAGGGGTTKVIPANTTIAPGGYYTYDFTGSYLNNTNDYARLLGSDQTTVWDSKSYTTATSGKSWCRKPDGAGWGLTQCDTPTKAATNGGGLGGGGGSTYTPGNLEIYVLNVGQGESQLIIGPTGRSLLIGVYEPGWNTDQGAQFVAAEIERITGGTHVNYIMPSHWHLDHMGYAGHGGIWSLLEEQGITTDAIIDRDGGEWVDGNSDDICDPDTEIVWHNAGTVSGTARNWVCWTDDPTTLGGQVHELAVLGSTTQIDLGISAGVTTTIVQVDADGVMQDGGLVPVAGDHTADATPPSENDYSITLWINWNMFDYVAAGDSDGQYDTSSFGYSYNDVEAVIVDRIDQEIEAAWVNHHGSSHSSSDDWVTVLSPQAVAFSCGGSNTYGHPGQEILDRYNTEGTAMYFTQQCDPTRTYYSSTFVDGNVEIITSDGEDYTVNGDPFTATDPTPPVPQPPTVGQVLINEFLPAPSGGANEWIELYNTTGVALDISGMWLDDISGGGSPMQIPASTIIQPGSYYVMEFGSGLLNNSGGDTVRFLSSDQGTTHDSRSYTSTSSNLSKCRTTNGGTWASGNCTATKNAAN
jgi:beta-lactamase superfamily II metal-dependent hydrolase